MAYDMTQDDSQYEQSGFDDGADLTDEEVDLSNSRAPRKRKHKITARKVAKVTGRVIFDTALATGTVLALHFLPFTPFSFSTMGAILMGASIFAGKETLQIGYSTGKKHFIRARSQGDKKSVKVMQTMEAASVIVPLLLLGASPITLAAGGIAALTYWHKNHQWFKKYYRSKKEAKNAKQR